MTTIIRLGRSTPYATSDALREDTLLWNIGQQITAFLTPRDIETVTAAQFKAFLTSTHPDMAVVSAEKTYRYVWDDELKMMVLKCFDTQVLGFADTANQPVQVGFEVSASYA